MPLSQALHRISTNVRFLTGTLLLPGFTAALAEIHDRRDPISPWQQGFAIPNAWPGARLLGTEGLGHGRILESEIATRAASDFSAGRSEVASPAGPTHPRPAPLY